MKNIFLLIFVPLILASCSFNYEEKKTSSKETKVVLNSDVGSMYDKALNYAKSGMYPEAIKGFISLLEVYPNDSASYYNIGLSYYSMRNLDSALFWYSKAIQKFPNYADLYINRSQVYLNQEKVNYEGAISDCQKAIQLDSTQYLPYLNIAVAEFLVGNVKEASNIVDGALVIFPDNPDIIKAVYNVHVQKNDFKKALAEIDRIIKKYPSNLNFVYDRGGLYLKNNEFKKAIIDFDVVINSNNVHYNVFYLRGVAKSKINEKNGACQDFEQAISLGMEPNEEISNYCK